MEEKYINELYSKVFYKNYGINLQPLIEAQM